MSLFLYIYLSIGIFYLPIYLYLSNSVGAAQQRQECSALRGHQPHHPQRRGAEPSGQGLQPARTVPLTQVCLGTVFH